ncbi:FAD dependent oxidoreductase-like protein superfamily [Periconia macrospinosa]|uniref:FAD dependent oxidoreductase-like protein superfamily n=1 Tax=Periconia macrospinosa TaxID=97972 RepID=A0A2V1EA40_9PLEO|nr:FAD dependent oxidoreductase-like protein superfamily [Periconia macrospinosa]
MSATANNTVIIGAGIIGLSTAYYLSDSKTIPPSSIHLVDASKELLHCASGWAGGFLAADWFAPSNASLGALSFKLHKDLSDRYNGRNTWGYCLSTGFSATQPQDCEAAVGGSGEDWLADGTSRVQATDSKRSVRMGPEWLKRTEEGTVEEISAQGTVAQIDPLRFCQWLLDQCLQRGVKIHQPARVISVSKNEDGLFDGVRLSEDGIEKELPCKRLVICSGAWSPKVFSSLFPKSKTRIPVFHLAGHSLLVKNQFYKVEEKDSEVCHAVFATDTLGFSPEWFSRIGGELYLAGLNSTAIPLPDAEESVKVDPKAIEQMKQCAAEMLGAVDGKPMEVKREALCFRPVTASGRPIVCRIPEENLGGLKTQGGGGVFIATGHGAWGISLAPGTGFVLSELIQGRAPSANISALALPSL